jgi:23S rRNA G2445 N2-methylase RlmL
MGIQRTDRLRLLGGFGSNKVMAGELSRLVRRALHDVRLPDPQKEGPSAVSYPFDPRIATVAMRYHRTCARALWELYSTDAPRLEPLYEQLRDAVASDARNWLVDNMALSVQAHAVGSFAAGERQIVGTVKNALIDGARARGLSWDVSPERPDLVLDVRGVGDSLRIAIDLAGRPMHQRGYRHASGMAPLREDLAAMLVMLARHRPREEVLVDPMAGSGTIAIEGACMASARYNWCSGRSPLGASVPALAAYAHGRALPLFADTEPLVLANELDPELASLCQQNAETAGVGASVEVRSGDFRDWAAQEMAQRVGESPYQGGLILANPPYGERMAEVGSLDALFRDLGDWCRQFRGWRAGFIVDNRLAFESAFGQRARVKKPLRNAQLKVTFYLFEL